MRDRSGVFVPFCDMSCARCNDIDTPVGIQVRQPREGFTMAIATGAIPASIRRPLRSASAAMKATVFFLKVLPMLPSKPLNRVTPSPVVERLCYPTVCGEAEGDLYRPSTGGPHPGVVVCLGVVPFEVDHPQVPRLGEALARAGFAALLYWSPSMRDFRLDPDDGENIALAYDALMARPDVFEGKSGLLGTCVGGSFALLAAEQPLIRDRLAFVAAFAPFASMWTLAEDIATGTRMDGTERVPWQVDQLTRHVYWRSFISMLDPDEAVLLEDVFADPSIKCDVSRLSGDGQAIYRLFTAEDIHEVRQALDDLPAGMRQRLNAMSPDRHLNDIHACHIVVGHDRDDDVIPVGESRRLSQMLAGREGFRYTEFGMFQHADPTQRKLSPVHLAIELGKFYRYVYPVFHSAT